MQDVFSDWRTGPKLGKKIAYLHLHLRILAIRVTTSASQRNNFVAEELRI
jgi:hypothetical protein